MHEGGFDVEHSVNGDFVFRDRRGEVFAAPPLAALPADPVVALTAQHRDAGLAITPRTRTKWEEGRMDLGLAVSSVIELEDPYFITRRETRTAHSARLAHDSAESCASAESSGQAPG